MNTRYTVAIIAPRPPIVQRALDGCVTDIGQLTPAQIRQLNKAVKDGTLVKCWNGAYPTPKRCWVGNYR